MEKIQAALDAGLKPVIIAVHVTPELALRRTFQRFEEYGRGAGINVMADIKAGLPDGLRKVHDRFGDAVQLTILDNRFPGQHKALHGWQHLKQLTQEENHERISQRLRAELDRHRDEGKISEACYRQANGDAPLAPSRGVDREGGRKDQRDGNERDGTKGSREATHLSPLDAGSATRPNHPNRPARAIAFEQLDQAEAVAKHPELMGAYRELAVQRQALAGLPVEAKARDDLLAYTKSDIQRRLDDGRIPPLPPVTMPSRGQERDR